MAFLPPTSAATGYDQPNSAAGLISGDVELPARHGQMDGALFARSAAHARGACQIGRA